jgi:diguanylate cyclase (GGDEF)-like protein
MGAGDLTTSKAKIWDRLDSIRLRLIVFALIAAIPFIWYRTADIQGDESAILEQIRAEAIATARRGVQQVEEDFSESRTLLSTLAKVPVISEGTPQDCADFLQSVRNLADWAKNLLVMNAKGTVTCGTDPDVVGLELGDRAYFQDAARTHDFAVSDFIYSRLDGRPILVTAYPIFGRNNTLQAIVSATLNLSWFDRTAQELGRDAGGTALLVDRYGRILAQYPRAEDMPGAERTDQRPLAALAHGDTGSFEGRDADGQRRLYGVTRVAGTNAVLAVGLSTEANLAASDRRFRTAYFTAGLIGTMIVLLAWLFGELHFVGPLRELLKATARLREGDLAARVEMGGLSSREFRELAASFNTMADRLAALATIDGLTGVANRRRFDQYLIEEWRRSLRSRKPLALALIDIDQFKSFNDSNGHQAGDECLRRVAMELSNFARRTEDLVGRYGGEEFVLGLPGMNEADAYRHCERLRLAIESQMDLFDGDMRVTISIGVAVCTPDLMTTPETLVAMADAALYDAKRAGRNRTALYRRDVSPLAIKVA